MEYEEAMHAIARGIPTEIVDLNAEWKKVRVPTQASSNFAINREQGHWAELTLARGLKKVIGAEYDVIQYGESGTSVAGEPGFYEFYTRYRDELETIGKRPDLLIVPKGTSPTEDISAMDKKSQDLCVQHAILGIEVRSSAFLKRTYDRVYKDEPGKFLSFTPKSEDISAILKWIKVYNVSHYYIQVFFDEVYAISFENILKIISMGQKKGVFRVEKNPRNQMKTTFHINVNQGLKIGDVSTMPDHQSDITKMRHGRLLHRVKFSNGAITLGQGLVLQIITDATKTR